MDCDRLTEFLHHKPVVPGIQMHLSLLEVPVQRRLRRLGQERGGHYREGAEQHPGRDHAAAELSGPFCALCSGGHLEAGDSPA